MLLWRLSTRQHADAFDGGYGLLFDGRWNTTGHAVTYCATSPSLSVLEKLVHIEDPALLPDLVMVAYEAPASLPCEQVTLGELPHDWRHQETWTQKRGDDWHQARAAALLQVPSAIVPVWDAPDANFLVNHNHPAVAKIRVRTREPFALDPRSFRLAAD